MSLEVKRTTRRYLGVLNLLRGACVCVGGGRGVVAGGKVEKGDP